MNFHCNICDKYYKTYKSLYTHNSIYHNNTEEVGKQCEFCNKSYATKYTLDRHYTTCNSKPINTNINNTNNNNNDNNHNDNNHIKGDYNNHINGNENDNINGNDNNNVNGDDNHINSHNISVIVNLGNENLSELLTVKQQLNILNKRNKCLEYIIKYIHFNDKFPQFKNIMIDDLKSNKAFKFDSSKKDYIVVTKDDLLDDLIENRLSDIEEFCVNNDEDIKKITKQRILKYIHKMEKEYENPKSIFFKEQKDNIELSIYNERDVIKPIQKHIRQLKLKQS